MIEQRAWASGRSWWVTAEKPQGGFVLVREDAIFTAWAALCDAKIELRDFRIWLASFEVLERRIGLRADRTPTYTEVEFRRLVGGVGREHFRTSVRQLERAGLGKWQDHAIDLPGSRSKKGSGGGRLVPIPRPMLRYLAQNTGRAFIATALGHIIRCLYFRGSECVSGGYCKSSWVADTFSVSLRSVKDARAKLISLGFLVPLQADQLRLNRFGSPVLVNLSWASTTESAHRSAELTTETAPPRTQESSFLRKRSDHQKPARAPDPSGVFDRNEKKPSMRDVKLGDLESPKRLAALFVDAERLGLVRRSDVDRLNFFAVAEHSRRVGKVNPAGLFGSLVRRRCYSYIAQADEESARKQLAALCEMGHLFTSRGITHPDPSDRGNQTLPNRNTSPTARSGPAPNERKVRAK
jgi:hypothetical protein